MTYGRIIAIGFPFSMIGTTLNSIIRADGNPKYAMTSMVICPAHRIRPEFLFAVPAVYTGHMLLLQ